MGSLRPSGGFPSKGQGEGQVYQAARKEIDATI